MSVGWLIDASAFELYYEELANSVTASGHKVVVLNRPSPPYQWSDTDHVYRKAFPIGSCVVTHGDVDLVTRVLKDQIWTPGAFASVSRYFCSHYYAHFGRFLLNRDYVMLPFAELPRCQNFLFEILGRNDTLFVRPDSPLKLFTGMTISRSTFVRDYEFMRFYEFPIESMVVVSSPKKVLAEWRFVVADGQIVAGSQYMDGNEKVSRLANDLDARNFAKDVLTGDYEPDPVWILDICKTEDNQFHLLEIGAFSFADLYSCDKMPLSSPFPLLPSQSTIPTSHKK